MEAQSYNNDNILSQAKLYDKIVKENIHKVLPELIRDILGIVIAKQEDLQESLQYTTERIPDQLCKITDIQGNTYILQLEWQSEDDPSMQDRMLTYRAMLRRKYGMVVKQYVIFLAREKSSMSDFIEEENLKFSYSLIPLQKYSHRIFLDSKSPEQKLLAIFGNFDTTPPVDVIKEILQGVTAHKKGQLNTNRYVKQLRALVQLRKLNKEFKTAMAITTKFKIEEDAYYQEGIETGIEKGIKRGIEKTKREVIEGLITQTSLSNEIIVQATKTTLSFVREIREKLDAQGSLQS
ncbi:hypothetical protein PBAL39_08080 [Pedobacter sp. BAL39]|uniref:hypothetical protein n=1 Tax=Pedobacter sp. BAL39 TaxID=391596 RepID=UPI000155996C|nr:hypothetical protein [Pedobacter sp. BAL39]EDM35021.1 hypothetical protein PBAL39_08080 [Pedobacter sp. BAL39]